MTSSRQGGQLTGGFGSAIPPLMFLLIFCISIILLSNQMLNSTLEKENRVTERTLTTLNPTTLIIGNVIVLYMVGAVQILVFLPGVSGRAVSHFRRPTGSRSNRERAPVV